MGLIKKNILASWTVQLTEWTDPDAHLQCDQIKIAKCL